MIKLSDKEKMKTLLKTLYFVFLLAFNPNAFSTAICSSLADCRELAESGNADAQMEMGMIYVRGHDMAEKDYYEANLWFLMAAEQNNIDGMYNMGVSYHIGLGVEKDHSLAVEWYEKASKLGHDRASLSLGKLHLKDSDMKEQSLLMAYLYIKLAAQQGSKEAIKYITMLDENMSAEEKRTSKKLFNVFTRDW